MKEKLLHERALVTCIIMLFVCIILKLFGVQWFDLNTDIPILQEIDKVVMNSEILSFIYSFVLLWINGILVILCTTKQIPRKHFWEYTYLIIISVNLDNSIIVCILDTLMLLTVCFVVSPNKRTLLNFIGVFILNIAYQFVSLYIRDLGFHLSNYGMTCSLLFMIDYYLMLVITYLYLKKGDKDICSISHHFGSYLVNLLWRTHLKVSKQCSKNKKGD